MPGAPVESITRREGNAGVDRRVLGLESRLPLGSPGVRAAKAARWPPAEPPDRATKEGSPPPYSPMWAWTQAMARLQSTIWSGQAALALARN